MKTCWVRVPPDQTGNYLVTPGGRYAALLSVDDRANLSDATKALGDDGFQVSYAWMTGQPNRATYFVDNWLAGLPAPSSGNVWMYFELNFTGDVPRTIQGTFEKCILWICGSGTIEYAFAAQQVADDFHPCAPGDPQGTALQPPPPAPPRSSAWKPVLVGAGIGGAALGLLWLASD